MVKITRTEQFENEDAYYLSNVQIGVTFEYFQLELFSGTRTRLYLTSPSHAKRIATILSQHIGLYEKQYGEIKEAAPASQTESGVSEKKIGF